MCSVYSTTRNATWTKSTFGVDLPIAEQNDVYPGHSGPIIVKSHKNNRVAAGTARFGLIPAWAKDTSIGKHTYNARTETASEKPSFRTAWRKRHFAIALAECFYEPCYETSKAVRWQISQVNDEPMGIASLWDSCTNPETGEIIASFTMLTINADHHPVLNRFHKPNDEKRTPYILPRHNFSDWLDATPDIAIELLAINHMPELIGQVHIGSN